MICRLPAADRAVVDARKITDYLLSPSHPQGRTKRLFFESFGFHLDDWIVLHAALLQHGRLQPVGAEEETAFGYKYVIDGPLASPDGRNPGVRSVWFVEKGEDYPRFVTAYPGRFHP